MKVEKLPKSQIKVEMMITKERFTEALDKAFEVENEKVTIKGFRKGKAPKSKYIALYGKESLYPEALNICIMEDLDKHIYSSQEFRIMSQPKVDLAKDSEPGETDINYTVIFDVFPDVTMGQYKEFEIEVKKPEATDDEIDAKIKQLLEKQIVQNLKEGTLEEGNIAIFDFEGYLDGELFPGGSAQNYELKIGSHQFIPGFEEQMVGMKSKEEKEIKVTFPAEYFEKSLANKEVIFKMKLHEIKEEITPELTEEIIKELNIDGVNSKDELKTHLISEIIENKEKMNENSINQQIMGKLRAQMICELPESLIKDRKKYLLNDYENQLKQYNISLELYLQFNNMKKEDFEAFLEEEAINSLYLELAVLEVIKLEKIAISAEELNEKIAELKKEKITDQEKMYLEQHLMDAKAREIIFGSVIKKLV